MKVGVKTIPKVFVSDVSGFRLMLPEACWLHCEAGQLRSVVTAEQTDIRRREQFQHVRCANGALNAAANLHVVHDLPLEAVLVRRDRAGDVVGRIAVTAGRRQVFEEGHILNDRDANFAEAFNNVESRTGNRERRATLTGQIVDLEVAAGVELDGFRTVFRTERDADWRLRPRQLTAPFAEVTGDRTGDNLLTGVALHEALRSNVA